MIFVGVDPGLMHPAVAILERDQVVAYALPPAPKNELLWRRAEMVALTAFDKLVRRRNCYMSRVVVGIETAAFVPHSRSMEQMACVRQAVYSHFAAKLRADLFSAYEVNPSEAKQAVAKGNATKRQVVEAVKIMLPRLFDNLRVYTSAGNVREEVSAVADAVAIARVARRKWREEQLCVGIPPTSG